MGNTAKITEHPNGVTSIRFQIQGSLKDFFKEELQSEPSNVQESDGDYLKYRGKCKEMSEALVAENPSLTLVRGYYHCPFWGSAEQHWWCKDQDGNIIDPTKDQFPSKGNGEYEEFDGMCKCSQCGERFKENEAYTIHGSHVFCSYSCYGHYVM